VYVSCSVTKEFVASIPQKISDPKPLANSFEKPIVIAERATPGVVHFKGGTVNTYVLADPAFLGIFVKVSCSEADMTPALDTIIIFCPV